MSEVTLYIEEVEEGEEVPPPPDEIAADHVDLGDLTDQSTAPPTVQHTASAESSAVKVDAVCGRGGASVCGVGERLFLFGGATREAEHFNDLVEVTLAGHFIDDTPLMTLH